MRLAHDSTDSHALATGEAAGKSQNFLQVSAGGCRARAHTQVGLRPRHPGGKKAALPFSPESWAAPASRTSTDQWVVGESKTARTLGVATVPPPCPTSLHRGFLTLQLQAQLWLCVCVCVCLFCSCSKWGLLSSCSAWSSHCGVFSCCRAHVLGHVGFSSCST